MPFNLSWEMELVSTTESTTQGLPSHMVGMAHVLMAHVGVQVVSESLSNFLSTSAVTAFKLSHSEVETFFEDAVTEMS